VDTGANTVQLTFNLMNLSGTEFVTEINLGVNPLINLSLLSVNWVSGDIAEDIIKGLACCKGDGGSRLDVGFVFGSSQGSRFTAGETSVYNLSGTGLSASSLFYPVDGNKGPQGVQFHIQGITGGGSGWNTGGEVPEPATYLSVGVGLFAAGYFRRKRNQRP